jgi:hypothetical protein
MRRLGFSSRLCTLFGNVTRLETDCERVFVAYLSLSEDELLRLKPLQCALDRLVRDVDQHSEVATAARHLSVSDIDRVNAFSETGISGEAQRHSHPRDALEDVADHHTRVLLGIYSQHPAQAVRDVVRAG